MRTVDGRRIHRMHSIERDSDGQPAQLVWQGDYVRDSITYLACPKCGSRRMVDSRCLSCWCDARNEYWRPVTDAERGLKL